MLLWGGRPACRLALPGNDTGKRSGRPTGAAARFSYRFYFPSPEATARASLQGGGRGDEGRILRHLFRG